VGCAHEGRASLLINFVIRTCLHLTVLTAVDRARKGRIGSRSASPTRVQGARSVDVAGLSKSKAVPKSVIFRWLSGVSRMCAECGAPKLADGSMDRWIDARPIDLTRWDGTGPVRHGMVGTK
jgi:hypothetical protein